jgi:hypothetical protein
MRGGFAKWLACGVLLVGTTVSTGLYSRYRLQKPERQQRSEYVDAMEGDRVCRPGYEAWAKPGSQAFVIVASATCGACLAVKSFDEEIYQYAVAHMMPVFYVLSDKPENRERERELVSWKRSVLRVHSLLDFGLARVPTVARVDHRGVIQSRWTGTVPDGQHDAVFASLTSGRGIQTYARIASSELRSFVASRHAQVLAFSELNKDPTIVAKIIPPAEVYVRARRELNPDTVTVVDCGSILNPAFCQDAGINLAVAHFREVVLSGLPDRPAVCSSN